MSRYTCWTALGSAVLCMLSSNASQAASTTSAHTTGGLRPQHIEIDNIPALPTPPSTSDCLALFGIHCYQPPQFAKAYNLTPLHAIGIDGSGTTIEIVDSFGSPTIAHDL